MLGPGVSLGSGTGSVPVGLAVGSPSVVGVAVLAGSVGVAVTGPPRRGSSGAAIREGSSRKRGHPAPSRTAPRTIKQRANKVRPGRAIGLLLIAQCSINLILSL